MASLLDLLGEPARGQVAVCSQGTRYDHRIVARGIFKSANVPERVCAIIGESLPIKADVIGFSSLGTQRRSSAHIMRSPAAKDKLAHFQSVRFSNR